MRTLLNILILISNVLLADRYVRAGSDPFTDYHSKITRTARIFSGIALRIGIHDGSLTESQLFSELLSIESNLDYVANFDKAKMDRFFSNLTGFDLSSKQVNRVNELEEKIMMLSSVQRQYEEIANPDEVQSIYDYMDKLLSFSKMDTNFTFSDDLDSAVPSALLRLGHIASGNAATLSKTKFDGLAEDLEKIVKVVTGIGSIRKTLDAHKELIGDGILDSALVRSVEMIKIFFSAESKKIDVDDVPKKFHDQLILVNSLANQFDEVAPSIQVAISIMNSTRNSVASGFLNGFQDVNKLRNDLQDTWLSTIIANYDPQLISSELKPLEQFDTAAKLHAKWQSVNGLGEGSGISEILKTILNLFKRSQGTSFNANWTTLQSKDAPTETYKYANSMYNLVETILKFRKHLRTFTGKLTRIVKQLAELEELTKFKDKIKSTTGRSVQQMANDLPKKEAVDRLIEVLNYTTPKIKDIEDTWKGTKVPMIESNRGDVGVFLSSKTRKKFFEYFDFLKTIKPQLESLSEAVTLLRTIRSLESDANFQSTLSDVTGKISNATVDFISLRAVPNALKQMSTSRIEELVQLKSIEGPARVLGEAALVLDTAHKMLSWKTDIEKLLDRGWIVAKKIKSKSNLVEGWGNFAELSDGLGALLDDLEVKKSALVAGFRIKRQPTSLKDIVSKMTVLQGLPDFDIDLRSRIEVLRQLSNVPDADEMRRTMEKLDGLDLKFSAHQSALSSVGQQVATAQSLFGAIVKPTPAASSGGGANSNAPNSSNPDHRIAPIPGRAPSSDAVSGSGSAVVTSETEGSSLITKVIIGIVCSMIACGVISGVTAYFRYFRRKEVKKGPVIPAADPAKIVPISTTSPNVEDHEDAKPIDDSEEPENEKQEPKSRESKKSRTPAVVEVNDPSDVPKSKLKIPFVIGNLHPTDREDAIFLIHGLFLCLERERQSKNEEARTLANKNPTCMAELERFKGEYERNTLILYTRLGDDLHSFICREVAPAKFRLLVVAFEEIVQVVTDDKKFDNNEFAEAKFAHFIIFLWNPWRLGMKETWPINEDEKRLFPPALPQYCVTFQFKHRLLTFEPLEEDIARNPNVTLLLMPYFLRLAEVNAYVEGLRQPCASMTSIFADGCETRVRCFDHARFVLSDGELVNATVFDTPYAEYARYQAKIVVAATPGKFNRHDAVTRMLCDLKPAYTVTLDCDKFYENLPANSEYTYSIYRESSIYSEGNLEILFQSVTINRNGEIAHAVKNLTVRGITVDGTIRKDAAFRRVVARVLQKATRRNSVTLYNNESVVFFDEEGGALAGTIAGIEIIASSINSHFSSVCDTSLQLRRMLTRRGGMFTSPDQVMFMIYVALDMFLQEQRQVPLTEQDWRNLENCLNMELETEVRRRGGPMKQVEASTMKTAQTMTDKSKKAKKAKKTKAATEDSLKMAEKSKKAKKAKKAKKTKATTEDSLKMAEKSKKAKKAKKAKKTKATTEDSLKTIENSKKATKTAKSKKSAETLKTAKSKEANAPVELECDSTQMDG